MNITKEGWAKIIGAVMLAIMTIAGVLLGVDVQLQNVQQAGPVVGSQAITERINLDSFGDNQISNGGDLTFWSGNRTGQTIKLTGDTGAIEATTLTVTSLVSQVVSFEGEDANITDTLLVETLTVTGTATAGATSIGGGFGSTGCTVSAAGVLQCDGAATIGGALNVTGSLGIAGTTFSGTMHYGVASAYVSGTAIATGFATTATSCVVSPATQQLTATVRISATTAFSAETSFNGGKFYWMCGQ